MTEITKDITIEELTESYSFSVDYLSKNGIRCIVCGEPIWGTLEEAAEEKGFNASDIERFVSELKQLAEQPENDSPYASAKIDVKKM